MVRFRFRDRRHSLPDCRALDDGDDASLAKILESTDAKTAKALGRTVKNFDDVVWKANERQLVTEGKSNTVIIVSIMKVSPQ